MEKNLKEKAEKILAEYGVVADISEFAELIDDPNAVLRLSNCRTAVAAAILKTKEEFYAKLYLKIDKVLDAELDIEDWSEQVHRKIQTIDAELSDLLLEI